MIGSQPRPSSSNNNKIDWSSFPARAKANSAEYTRVVFFEGIGATQDQVQRVLTTPVPLFDPASVHVPSRDLPEVAVVPNWARRWIPWMPRSMALKFWRMDIGGPRDGIWCPFNVYEAEKTRPHATNTVLFGISRGALNAFKTVINLDTTKREVPKFVVLEGCPGSIPEVLEWRYGPRLASWVETLLTWFTEYDPRSAREFSPLALAARFPKTVPVLLVASEADTKVPCEHTLRLKKALEDAGHPNVKAVVIPKDANVGHNGLYGGHPVYTQQYYSAVQYMFNKHCPDTTGEGSSSPARRVK